MDTCMCYCQLGVLLGGAPGSSSKSKNSWEPKLEKIVGILVLRWYISQPKSTYFKDFITSGMVWGRESTGIYKELPGRTQVGHFTSTFLSAEAQRHCYRHTIRTNSDQGQDRLGLTLTKSSFLQSYSAFVKPVWFLVCFLWITPPCYGKINSLAHPQVDSHVDIHPRQHILRRPLRLPG